MSERESIRMIVNDIFYGYVANGSEALGQILNLGLDRIHFMSDDAIKNWISSALDIAEEIYSWKKDGVLKRRISLYRKSLEHCNGRDNLITFFTNVALSCEGLGNLPGFGMSNVSNDKGRMKSKGKIWINPEKTSYRGV